MDLEYIRIADEQGLGNGRRENIEIVGDSAAADERWGFSVGDNGASMVGKALSLPGGGFNFKLMDGGPGDPGLDFKK